MKPKQSRSDRDWTPYMRRALELADEGVAKGDIPIGAVLVDMNGKIVAEAHNAREIFEDPTAHAEILVVRKTAEANKQWRLNGYTLVVTLEPCTMCSGALSLARVDRVVYGAKDPKAGAMGSIYQVHDDKRLNHTIELVTGVLEAECRDILLKFFKSKRQ